MTSYVAVFAAGLLLAFVLTPVVRRLAVRWGAIDEPGDRKIHVQPVPRLGGLAVMPAVAIAVGGALLLNAAMRPAIAGVPGATRWIQLVLATMVVFVVGSIDDVSGLSARLKFLYEMAAASVVVFVAGAFYTFDLAPFAGSVHFGPLAPIIGILWIASITNAINMTDGMDGVACGLGAIAAAALGVMSLLLGNTIAATVLLALAGGLIGFLPHNLLQPKTFLGDSGSLAVGFVLGAASYIGLERNGTWLAIPALLALALPLAELNLTVLRRTLAALNVVHLRHLPSERFALERGRPGLFRADRRHVHHRLLEMGLQPRWALVLLYALGGALALCAVAAVRWPYLGPFAGLLALVALVYFAPRWLYQELRLLERGALLPLFENGFVRSRAFHVVYDVIAIVGSYVIAELLVQGPNAHAGGVRTSARVGTVALAAVLGLWLGGVYRMTYRHAGLSEVLRGSRAVVLGVVLGAGVSVLAFDHRLRAATWLLLTFFLLSSVVAGRFSFRVLSHIYERGRGGGRRVLIFGAGRGGGSALREMLANPTLGLVPVAFADDDSGKWGRQFQGFQVHQGAELGMILRSLEIDFLVISTNKISQSRRSALEDECLAAGVRLLRFGLQWNESAEAEGARLSYLDDHERFGVSPVDIQSTGIADASTQPGVNLASPN